MNPPDTSVRSFTDRTRTAEPNHRLLAAARADETRRKTSLPTLEPGSLIHVLHQIYGREKLPNPELISTIDTSRLGTQEEELLRLKALSSSATDEERQVALYRIMLADLQKEYNLPKYNPAATRKKAYAQ
jgi:hypothetical protein